MSDGGAIGRQRDNLAAVLNAAGCTFDDIVDITTVQTDPATQFGVILAVKDKVFAQEPYSELDRRWSELARGFRLRDQSHRTHSAVTIRPLTCAATAGGRRRSS